jgi:SEC-C motif domain protein
VLSGIGFANGGFFWLCGCTRLPGLKSVKIRRMNDILMRPNGTGLAGGNQVLITLITPCPCGRVSIPATRTAKAQPLPFSACCGPYLNENVATPAPDAETLMRSRYTAFVLGRHDYLLATWHAGTRPADLMLDPATKWLGLEVRSHTTQDADHAEVEFVARCREGGRATRLHERSRFVRESGRWFYVDGDQF